MAQPRLPLPQHARQDEREFTIGAFVDCVHVPASVTPDQAVNVWARVAATIERVADVRRNLICQSLALGLIPPAPTRRTPGGARLPETARSFYLANTWFTEELLAKPLAKLQAVLQPHRRASVEESGCKPGTSTTTATVDDLLRGAEAALQQLRRRQGALHRHFAYMGYAVDGATSRLDFAYQSAGVPVETAVELFYILALDKLHSLRATGANAAAPHFLRK